MSDDFLVKPQPITAGTKFGTFNKIVDDTLFVNQYPNADPSLKICGDDANSVWQSGHYYRLYDRNSGAPYCTAANGDNLAFINIFGKRGTEIRYSGTGELNSDRDRVMDTIEVTYQDDTGIYHTQKAYDRNHDGIVGKDEIEEINKFDMHFGL